MDLHRLIDIECKRNLKGSPKELKRLAYISFVRSGLEYACTVWDPQYKLEEDALEKPQRRAARLGCPQKTLF